MNRQKTLTWAAPDGVTFVLISVFDESFGAVTVVVLLLNEGVLGAVVGDHEDDVGCCRLVHFSACSFNCFILSDSAISLDKGCIKRKKKQM